MNFRKIIDYFDQDFLAKIAMVQVILAMIIMAIFTWQRFSFDRYVEKNCKKSNDKYCFMKNDVEYICKKDKDCIVKTISVNGKTQTVVYYKEKD